MDICEYLRLARRIIYKLANKYGKNHITKMLKDEEAMGNLASELMFADMKWDANYKGVNGPINRFTYRKQRAIWAILAFINTYQKRRFISLDRLLAKGRDFLQPHSNVASLKETVQYCCTKREAEWINLYYLHNYTFREIGEQYKITHANVHHTIKTALLKVRKEIA